MQITFVLSTEPSDSVLKVNSPFKSPFFISFHFHFSVHQVFPKPPTLLLLLLIPFLIHLPPSRLQVASTAVNHTMHVSFFSIPSINHTLKISKALRGCCVINALTLTALIHIYKYIYLFIIHHTSSWNSQGY